MPNQLKPGTRRLSYVETRQAAKALDILAAAKSTNVSALIREATEDYLKKVDKDNSVRKLALQIVTELPDDAEERAEADLDPKTMEQLTAVMKKIRR
jgi:Holliday junction resolvasome RuvABC DNA-binding subunit